MTQAFIESRGTHVLPLEFGRAYAGHRSRRGRLGRGRRGPSVPRRDERRLDGRDARTRPQRHRRRRAGPGGNPRLRAQRAAHQPGAGAARPRAGRGRARGVQPRPLRHRAAPTRTRWRSSWRAATTSSAASRERWQVISPAQAYHGPTMETLALTGRPGMQRPLRPVPPAPPPHPARARGASTPPARRRSRLSTGRSRRRGRGTCRRSSARRSARPPSRRTRPPQRFWEGLAERRDATRLPRLLRRGRDRRRSNGAMVRGRGDRVRARHHRDGEGTRRGVRGDRRGARAANTSTRRSRSGSRTVHARAHVGRRARSPARSGSRCSKPCGRSGLIDRVRERGPSLRDELAGALAGIPMVREVRGHGYLLGVEYVDPRDGRSFLPPELARRRQDRRRRVRTRTHHVVDAADPRRLRGRPDAVRAARSSPPTTSWRRWSPGSPTPSARSRRRSSRSCPRHRRTETRDELDERSDGAAPRPDHPARGADPAGARQRVAR